MDVRHRLIGLGLAALGASRAHLWVPARFRGRGAVLAFHHVRPWRDRGFSPNRELEITPEYLDGVLAILRARGFRIVSLDEALAEPDESHPAPFAALTFDDGYRDFEEWALPILRRADAPATLFVTSGFADRTASPWWIVVEEALAGLDRVEIRIDDRDFARSCATDAEKQAAGAALLPLLRAASEAGRERAVAELAAGIDARAITADICLGWAGIADIARDPLVTIGAHTLTHPMLAKLPADEAKREIEASKTAIEARIGRPVRHFAYPVGDLSAAGPRDYALAREAGFAAAVTTCPGMIFPRHAAAPHALPRLSVNGRHQSAAAFEALLTGLPFALWNLGRRASVS